MNLQIPLDVLQQYSIGPWFDLIYFITQRGVVEHMGNSLCVITGQGLSGLTADGSPKSDGQTTHRDHDPTAP